MKILKLILIFLQPILGKKTPVTMRNLKSQILFKKEILIGVEYAMPGIAKEFSKLGIKAVKYYPDAIAWDNMQPFEDSEINFKVLDGFVTEFSGSQLTDLVVALKSRSKWASKGLFNPTPKEFVNAYKNG